MRSPSIVTLPRQDFNSCSATLKSTLQKKERAFALPPPFLLYGTDSTGVLRTAERWSSAIVSSQAVVNVKYIPNVPLLACQPAPVIPEPH